MSKELEALEFLGKIYTKRNLQDFPIGNQPKEIVKMKVKKMPEFKTLQKALKRNEPMKVINGINYKGQDVMLCPNCERNAGKINDRYCSHCGQALDWS